MKQVPFKICITMAGAVSAGAYTAGVIDYLLESLHLWQEAKDNNQKIKEEFPDNYESHKEYDTTIPMHDVVIEVIGGASAGGITGTLMFLTLLENFYQNRAANEKENKLYASWVDLADRGEKNTLSKLLSVDDIINSGQVESLLNTEPIEEIADRAFNEIDVGEYPAYVSKNLDLILTVSNLRGVRYKIDFIGKDRSAGNYITNHSGFFRYRATNIDNQPGMPDGDALYYVLDLKKINESDIRNLKNATLSTAAFPIGLKPRKNVIPSEYLQRYSKYLFNKQHGISVELPEEANFRFVSVDGGLINNEPFGYTLKVLKESHPEIEEQRNYAMIMIDPFPNYFEKPSTYNGATDIISVGKNVLQALRNQVLFKQDDIIDALDHNNDTRFLIAPSRKENKLNPENGKMEWTRMPNALACGALGGFSGFLDREFREHDYHLGRQNCQVFIRYYFAVEEKDIKSKFGTDIHDDAVNRFSYHVPPRDTSGTKLFPIIPDMRVLKAFSNEYDTVNYPYDADVSFKDFPSLDMQEFEKKYKKEILGRIKKIRKHYADNFWVNTAASLFGADNKIYKYLMSEIEKGLKNEDLLIKDQKQ